MILIDSAVWIDHFRSADHRLVALLEEGQAITHPFIIGELALGSLRQRREILTLLKNLPEAIVAQPAEMLAFIEQHRLSNSGIGYVDVALLASARLSSARLWTHDRKLHKIAVDLNLAT